MPVIGDPSPGNPGKWPVVVTSWTVDRSWASLWGSLDPYDNSVRGVLIFLLEMRRHPMKSRHFPRISQPGTAPRSTEPSHPPVPASRQPLVTRRAGVRSEEDIGACGFKVLKEQVVVTLYPRSQDPRVAPYLWISSPNSQRF